MVIAPDAPTVAPGDLIFDGDCAFCSASAEFLRRRVPTAARVQPWQSADLDALGVTAEQCDQAVQWVAASAGRAARVSAGALAVADLLRTSTQRRWRVLGRLLALGPVQLVARPVYGWVARHRDRMPGGTAACAVPPPGRRQSHT